MLLPCYFRDADYVIADAAATMLLLIRCRLMPLLR